jgi:hypothetical protein
VDAHAVRAAFDAQIRRKTRADEPGAVVQADAGVLRQLAPGTQTSRVTWSALTSGSADAVVAAQVRYFAACGTPVEWKLCDYDQPADLAQRLLAAGFVADDEELMLVAETAAIDSEVRLPDDVRLDLVTDQAGVEAMMAVHDLAFAGLCGGGTVPAWRGRGIFRALVAYRAGLGAARGYRQPSCPQRGPQDSQTTWINYRPRRHRQSRVHIYRPAGPGRLYPHQRGRHRRAPGPGS